MLNINRVMVLYWFHRINEQNRMTAMVSRASHIWYSYQILNVACINVRYLYWIWRMTWNFFWFWIVAEFYLTKFVWFFKIRDRFTVCRVCSITKLLVFCLSLYLVYMSFYSIENRPKWLYLFNGLYLLASVILVG